MPLDKHDSLSLARERFKSQRTASGKPIQHPGAYHPIAQDVKQRLPDLVAGGPDVSRRDEPEALELPSGDAWHGLA